MRKDIKKRCLSTVNPSPVHPDYISGLVQADGSFYISLKKTVSARKIIPYAIFTLTQDLDSIGVLELVQTKLACGHIDRNINKHSAEFVVSTISELQSVIIPHFKTYPLHGEKQNAFNILVIIVERLAKGEQFNSQGLAEIIQLANLMNKLSQRKTTAYDMIGVSPVKDTPESSLPIKPVKLTSEFIIGLIDGDGSFYVSFAKDRKIKFGFNITGSIRDKVLFNDVKEELGCGTIRVLSPTVLRYNIESIKAIRDKLIPFMDKYKLHTNKVVHYNCFKEILTLYSEGVHKTKQGLIKILELAYNINKGGKRRKYTLKEYIELYIK